MRAAEALYPPQAYDWWWWVVLPAFLVLLLGWILFSRWLSRRPPKPLPAYELPTRWVPQKDAASGALARIDAVEQRSRAGELAPRDAHIELSAIVREFGWKRTGVDARMMTLEELRASRLSSVADAVATFYPIAFAPEPGSDVEPAIARARQVVTTWS